MNVKGIVVMLSVAACAAEPPHPSVAPEPAARVRPLDLLPDEPLGRPLDLADPAFAVCWSPDRDLDAIDETGVLRVALPNDATSWFLYRGQVLGFEYSVLERFASDIELELDVVRVPSVYDRHLALRRGEVDAIAGRLAALDVRGVRYSEPLATSTATVLQLEAFGIDAQTASSTERSVAMEEDLQGVPVHALRNAGWGPTLHELEAVAIPVEDKRTTEHLARLVADGSAELALGRRDVARMATRSLPGVAARPEVDEHEVGYHVGFRSTSPQLADLFDAWLVDQREDVDAAYRRHFVQRRQRPGHPDLELPQGAISPYDELFMEASDAGDWDWHLLAAQAYQESRFRPRARSWAGARGLMQLMPRTARELGVRDPDDPEEAVFGAVDYLTWLDRYWLDRDVEDDAFRLRLVLASYNAGIGHVGDARRLAAALGDDPDDWLAVADALIELQKPSRYRHPVVKYGYCRGREPVAYVERILRRAGSYRALSEAM